MDAQFFSRRLKAQSMSPSHTNFEERGKTSEDGQGE